MRTAFFVTSAMFFEYIVVSIQNSVCNYDSKIGGRIYVIFK
jgi:hypothetical protein